MIASFSGMRRPVPVVVCGVVLGVSIGCLAIAGPLSYHQSGMLGLAAAGLASGCCCAGALGAFCAALWLRQPHHMLASALIGMTVRMGIAMTAALVVQLGGGALAEAGFVYYLLVFYLVTLAFETAVVVRP